MKSIPTLVVGLLLLSAAQAAPTLPKLVAIESDAEYNTLTWVNGYYKNPQPDVLVKRVYVMSRMGYFEQEGQTAQAVGFFATIFAQNPARVDAWFAEFRALPAAHQRLLAAAAWKAGLPRGENRVKSAPGASETAVADLLSQKPVSLGETAVLSVASMNFEWGAFLASGNERHVVNILAAVGSQTPDLTASARISLAMRAAQDSRVMDICRTQLNSQPAAVQDFLRAALKDSKAGKPNI